jgi:hypothetical protein
MWAADGRARPERRDERAALPIEHRLHAKPTRSFERDGRRPTGERDSPISAGFCIDAEVPPDRADVRAPKLRVRR